MSDLRGYKRDSGDRDGLGRQAGISRSMWHRRIAIVALVGLGLPSVFAPNVCAQGERFQGTFAEATFQARSSPKPERTQQRKTCGPSRLSTRARTP